MQCDGRPPVEEAGCRSEGERLDHLSVRNVRRINMFKVSEYKFIYSYSLLFAIQLS